MLDLSLGVRAVLSFMTALVMGLLVGPMMIRRLKALAFGQAVRSCGPQTHLKKEGTPTMGGVLILGATTLSTVLFAHWNIFIAVLLFVFLGHGALGWVDDYRKVVYRDPNGMKAREKFLWQTVMSLGVGGALVFALQMTPEGTFASSISDWIQAGFPLNPGPGIDLVLPWLGHWAMPLGIVGFLIFVFIVVVGSSNAVNLTDGLDGLAALPSALVAGGLSIWAVVMSTVASGTYSWTLGTAAPVAEIVIFGAGLAGSSLAFLWFNAHPAKVFMGDVGALAIGAALGTMAVMAKAEIALAVMGVVFVMETVSVMMQTVYFRLTHGKRIFKMAPIHHHFELSGWAETQVVVRFWIITVVAVLLGLSPLLG